MAQIQESHGRRDDVQWEGHEGDPTPGGGKWLTGALVLVAIAWIVAMVQIFRLPVQEVRVGAESTIWMAVALSSGIGAFILLIWKLHRA